MKKKKKMVVVERRGEENQHISGEHILNKLTDLGKRCLGNTILWYLQKVKPGRLGGQS